ncbi:enoyl-CoA hydratase domain-containing protein 3, mitochondrial-like [Oppia nitens]|uniref:enoyl-CoA hydratase domain-containing protein 3, mitochondrial-like n=1 Tax=Oppia nitens TaxID=1686743 RepID=UPI0023DB5D9F|nr:enoyl-CoA hydratase domain-containing protein 3, mitochondrial-like [Oppia nitens]
MRQMFGLVTKTLTTRIVRSLHTTSQLSTLLVNESDGVRHVVLNNPKKRNVLSLAMIERLREVIVDSPSLRCVVVSSNGPVFSSGHDLKELTTQTSEEYHRKVFDSCGQLMLSLQKLNVPVICQVNGLAAAAGCQLVAASDIVIASDKSKFSTPGASVGLFCSTPAIPLSRSVNLKAAAYMLMTGNTITAYEALKCGLVSRVVSESDINSETQNVVNAILCKSKSVIALGKHFFYSQINQNLETAYCNGSQVMVTNLGLRDAQEGIEAFIGKRTPLWSHSTDRYK